MEVIVAYAIFSLATALSLLYHVYIPVIKKLELEHPGSMVVSTPGTKTIALITLTLGSLLFSPVLIFPALLPKTSERYANALYSSLQD